MLCTGLKLALKRRVLGWPAENMLPNGPESLADDVVDAADIVVFNSFIMGALLDLFKLTGESTSMFYNITKYHKT